MWRRPRGRPIVRRIPGRLVLNRASPRLVSRLAIILAMVAPVAVAVGTVLGLVYENKPYSSAFFGVATGFAFVCVVVSHPAARAFEGATNRALDNPRAFLAYFRYHISAGELPKRTLIAVLSCYAPLVMFFVFLVGNMLFDFVT